MKILLDECLPLDFRHSFPGHDTHSAEWAGLKGKTNGELLRDAELAGCEVPLYIRAEVKGHIGHQRTAAGVGQAIAFCRLP
jgi:hypothetical protein